MNRWIIVLLVLFILSVTIECNGENERARREVLKISIIDKDDEDPKVTATILDKPPDPKLKRRVYSTPYRQVQQQPVETKTYSLPPVHHTYPRNGMFHASTVYSPGELTQSLGALVNSILMSKFKAPVNKIYIFSRNNHERPSEEPVFHVHQNNDQREEQFVPSVRLRPGEIIVKKPPAPRLPPAFSHNVLPNRYESSFASLGALPLSAKVELNHQVASPVKYDGDFKPTQPVTESPNESLPVASPLINNTPANEARRSKPIALATLGASYHLPKVTEAVEDVPNVNATNYQDLKTMHKSMKKLTYSPQFFLTSMPKKTMMLNEKVKAYTNFMKRPEYFLPKTEPDHHTEPSNFQYSFVRTPPRYNVRPTALPQIRMPQAQRRVSSPHHHTFTTQNFEFTTKDAIRRHPPPPTSSEEVIRYRVFESDNNNSDRDNSNINNSSDSGNLKSVNALSKQGYSTQDAIRLLESKRYTVPRDCSTRCLEKIQKNYDPVCGTDERTYLNEDMLICLSRCRKTACLSIIDANPPQRFSRQFRGFSPFGPVGGPPSFRGPFGAPSFIQGNFLDYGPSGAPQNFAPHGGPQNFGPPNFGPQNFGPPPGNFGPPSGNFGPPPTNFFPGNRGNRFNTPPGSGNIVQRQVNSPQRQPQLQQQQQQQQLQQQQQQQQQQQLQPQQQQQITRPQQSARPQQVNRNSPSFRQCMANCPTTNEYNPVCGDDQRDYYNQQRLICANSCGMAVKTVRRGTCNITNS